MEIDLFLMCARDSHLLSYLEEDPDYARISRLAVVQLTVSISSILREGDSFKFDLRSRIPRRNQWSLERDRSLERILYLILIFNRIVPHL